MEFTDIAMELSKEAWQASFHHPFVLQLQEGNLEPAIFRYYLIQDAYYLKVFFQKPITSWLIRLQTKR